MFLNTFVYFAGFGRGADYYENSPFSFNSAVGFLIAGVCLISLGAFFKYLYINKYDKDALKYIGNTALLLGIVFTMPFITAVWIYILGTFIVLIILGYVIYRLYVKKHNGGKEMLSLGYYSNVLIGFVLILWDKIKEKFF